ncbi:TPA: DUF3560 domain-containing protein [Aeromonas veronii]
MSATIITMEDVKAAAQQAEQAAQFVRCPVSVLVHWSESGAWQEEETVPFAEFEARALGVAMSYADGGYLKTKITVTFDDGETYQTRIDLAAGDELGFAHHCAGMISFYETDKGRDYYQRMDMIDLINFVKGIDFGAAAQRLAEQERDAALAVQIAKEKAAEAKKQAEAAAEQAYKAEVERLKTAPEFAHLAQIGSGAGGTEVAKNIRAQLKKAFAKDYQGCKFSVRCQRGGWSTSIYISWTDGPTRAQVRAEIDQFKGGRYNGMIDMYESNYCPFTDVFGSAEFMNTSRDLSDELRALAAQLVAAENNASDYNCPELEVSGRISITASGPLLDGKPWPLAEVVGEQAAPVEVAQVEAQIKPKFSAKLSGGLWSVTIQQGEQVAQFDGITATSMPDACRIAWAMLTQPTPPDDDPSGEPLPVEPAAEQGEAVEQGATAPATTRAQLLGDYSGRVEAKRGRLQVRAIKANKESDQRWVAANSAVAGIVFGQPILVGHHSERKHRRALERSDQAMRQSIALDHKAKRLESRAASVGQGGIASDDPNALEQLQEKLANREQLQDSFKKANKAKRGSVPAWRLSNNNAEIRRLRARIEELGRLHNAAPIEQKGHGWHMFEDDGRIQICFDGKPAAELRQLCKGAGFVWSPSRCAWVRKVTVRAVNEARRLARALPAED